MSVTVKVFFERTSGSVEIRRFLVNTTDGDCFATTKEKIKQLYTVLANSQFTLFWQDPDGDMVAFSTLEEMKDALTYVTDGVFRVYVFEGVETLDRPKSQNQKSSGSQQPGSHHPSNSQPSARAAFNTQNHDQPQGSSQSQPQGSSQSQPQGSSQSEPQQPQPGSGHTDEPVHLGIWCNACQGPVKGIRYKCLVCPDFDLCQTCEAKGVHSEHDMYKINHPHHFCQFHRGQRHPVFIHHSGHNPVFIHHGFTAPGAHADASASFSSSTGPIPGPFGGFQPDHPPGFSVPRTPGASASFSGSCGPNPGMFGGTNFSGSCGVNPSVSASFSGCCGLNPGMSGGANFHTGTNTDQKDKRNGIPSADGPFSQNGINISELLDQIGIKINFDTRAGTEAPQQENTQFTTPPMGTSFASWENMFRRARPNNTTRSGQAGAQTNADGNVHEDAGAKVNAEKSSSDQTNTPEDIFEFQIPSSIPIPMPGPTSTPAPASRSSSTEQIKPPAPAAASQNRDQSTASAGTPDTARPQTNLYPNLQVQQSLEQMLAMGFSDTDGWLTALLTENDGNIGVTLDAIMAKATEQLGNLHGGC
ncbi:hypothetical protein BsWGS_27180 [Bradybaena similaris]